MAEETNPLPKFCAYNSPLRTAENHIRFLFILSFCPHQHTKPVVETFDESINIRLGIVGRQADADGAIGVGGVEAKGGEGAAGGVGMGRTGGAA